jgi:hypothetical protein
MLSGFPEREGLDPSSLKDANGNPFVVEFEKDGKAACSGVGTVSGWIKRLRYPVQPEER